MVSASQQSLNNAITAVDAAFDTLEAAIAVSLIQRSQSAASSEAVQAELTVSWEAHSAKLEAEMTELHEENSFLKDDNQRLSNQLQQLQQEYLALQNIASGTVRKLDKSVKQLDLMLERA